MWPPKWGLEDMAKFLEKFRIVQTEEMPRIRRQYSRAIVARFNFIKVRNRPGVFGTPVGCHESSYTTRILNPSRAAHAVPGTSAYKVDIRASHDTNHQYSPSKTDARRSLHWVPSWAPDTVCTCALGGHLAMAGYPCC